MKAAFTLKGYCWLGLALLLVGCEMRAGADEATMGVKAPDIGLPDIGLPDIRPDGIGDDTLINPPDVGPVDDSDDSQPLDVKDDPEYLVPPQIAEKTQLSVTAGRAAWVQRDTPLAPPVIVVWNHGQDESPQALSIPYVSNPTRLVLDGDWLFYVDDVWGSDDVFGVRLSDEFWKIVAGGPGAQLIGDAQGGRVLYTDCSTCIPGADSATQSEVYEVNAVDDVPPKRLSTNKTHDAAPVFGTLSDGSNAIAWISNYSTVQILSGGETSSLPLPGLWVQDVVLHQGRVAWRPSPAIINPDSMIPSPMIINPDSMMPSDMYLTDVATGDSTPLTSHVEVGGQTPLGVVAAGSILAFAQGVFGSSRERIDVMDLTTTIPVLSIEEPSISGFSIGPNTLGFVAPREDNEGLQDVWILSL